jgi:hypothetical protein
LERTGNACIGSTVRRTCGTIDHVFLHNVRFACGAGHNSMRRTFALLCDGDPSDVTQERFQSLKRRAVPLAHVAAVFGGVIADVVESSSTYKEYLSRFHAFAHTPFHTEYSAEEPLLARALDPILEAHPLVDPFDDEEDRASSPAPVVPPQQAEPPPRPQAPPLRPQARKQPRITIQTQPDVSRNALQQLDQLKAKMSDTHIKPLISLIFCKILNLAYRPSCWKLKPELAALEKMLQKGEVDQEKIHQARQNLLKLFQQKAEAPTKKIVQPLKFLQVVYPWAIRTIVESMPPAFHAELVKLFAETRHIEKCTMDPLHFGTPLPEKIIMGTGAKSELITADFRTLLHSMMQEYTQLTWPSLIAHFIIASTTHASKFALHLFLDVDAKGDRELLRSIVVYIRDVYGGPLGLHSHSFFVYVEAKIPTVVEDVRAIAPHMLQADMLDKLRSSEQAGAGDAEEEQDDDDDES